MAFKIQISHYRGQVPERECTFDDSVYFREFPTKDKLIQAFSKNAELAGEIWSNDYDLCIEAILKLEDFPDGNKIPQRLAHTSYEIGNNCRLAVWQFKFYDEKDN